MKIKLKSIQYGKKEEKKYLYAADYEFNTDQKTPVQIASKIIETIFL